MFAALPEPIFLKIDFDGGEAHILETMAAEQRHRQFFILLETHWLDLDNACHCLLEEAGYYLPSDHAELVVKRVSRTAPGGVQPVDRGRAFARAVDASRDRSFRNRYGQEL